MKDICGVIPVMITPFTPDNKIDYDSLGKLIEWYIEKGVDALFAVCQSSEVLFLTLEERVALASFVVKQVNGRIPVIASGHISDTIEGQKEELLAMTKTGADAIVLVTNHLDPKNEGEEVFLNSLKILLDTLPADLPLGLYECPAPYRRLLSDNEFNFCAQSGRFVILKDVSCDYDTVVRRVKLSQGTPLKVVNANAAIAYPVMKAGVKGFCGVFTNFHPDLYVWLYRHGAEQPELANELSIWLSLTANAEALGYPKCAKIFQQRLGNFACTDSRVIKYDVLEKHWALTVILDQIKEGADIWRARLGL